MNSSSALKGHREGGSEEKSPWDKPPMMTFRIKNQDNFSMKRIVT